VQAAREVQTRLHKEQNSMKNLTCNLIGILLLSTLSLPVVYAQTPATPKNSSPRIVRQDAGLLIEEFSFSLKDVKMDHQGEVNTLNISISFRYVPNITKADYPDFRWLAKDVESLLNSYPNKDDYWEIVNKQVTALLLRKYSALASVTCEIKVDPSRLVPYSRSSRVTRERRNIFRGAGPSHPRLHHDAR
jgi:hypothetical protein